MHAARIRLAYELSFRHRAAASQSGTARSKTIIIKVLSELGKMKEHFAQHIFGILIIEDILETISLVGDSLAAGKLIRELGLRTRTGASIVGIERNGATLLNPSGDEELQAGDQVLLLGNREQLDAARRCS
jgi:K+/H+ antiporter YhaU regulatory subunit KhtT